MKPVPFWRPTNIRYHRTKSSHPGATWRLWFVRP